MRTSRRRNRIVTRHVADSPRPGGRGFRRLRRGGTLARKLVVRPMHPIRHLRGRRNGDGHVLERMESDLAPVSPAPAGAAAHATTGLPTAVPLLPGPVTAGRRLCFLLANSFTVISILLGMSAIVLATDGSVRAAAICLVGCVLADGLDGPLARRFKVSSPFGAQMDSLADMCSFGIATPVVVFMWMRGGVPDWTLLGACALIAVCSAIRLARFNVSPKDGRFFCGVPTTLTAAVLALSVLIVPSPHPAQAIVVAGIGLLMVSEFPYAKVSQVRKVPAVLWVLPAMGALVSMELTFLALVMLYLVSGPVLWLRQRRDSDTALPA